MPWGAAGIAGAKNPRQGVEGAKYTHHQPKSKGFRGVAGGLRGICVGFKGIGGIGGENPASGLPGRAIGRIIRGIIRLGRLVVFTRLVDEFVHRPDTDDEKNANRDGEIYMHGLTLPVLCRFAQPAQPRRVAPMRLTLHPGGVYPSGAFQNFKDSPI